MKKITEVNLIAMDSMQ
jgi:hypothetical protein